jgi:hypothetical protein
MGCFLAVFCFPIFIEKRVTQLPALQHHSVVQGLRRPDVVLLQDAKRRDLITQNCDQLLPAQTS